MREACCANALGWKYVMVNVRLEAGGQWCGYEGRQESAYSCLYEKWVFILRAKGRPPRIAPSILK